MTEPDGLATELLERWLNYLLPKSWPDRLHMLSEMHEQLLEDIGDFELYCRVSPLFIERLIERAGTPEVTCVEQAHIYANSGNPDHRTAAGLWLETQGYGR